MAIKVSGVKIGNLEAQIEGSEGASLKDVCKAIGVHHDGQQFIINGDRKNPVTDCNSIVRDGDSVEIYDRPKAGK